MPKKRINVSIEEDLYNRAKAIGISLSAFLENRLREFLENQKIEWARPDSNRRPPPCQGDVITS